MLLIFGAEFTKQYVTLHGHEIQPTTESQIIEQPTRKRFDNSAIRP